LPEGGIVIAEHSSKKELSLPLTSLRLRKKYRYGDTSLTLYESIGKKAKIEEGERS